MADFNIRTDAVDVEQIMRQIRARIQAKRGVDYTDEQIQELANVKLERFLDPKGVRSDLVEQFKRARDRKLEPFQPQQYGVDANDLYGSSKALVRLVRALLRPILKLLLNANRLVQVLHQAKRNQHYLRKAVLPSSREKPAARRSRYALLRTGPQPRARAHPGRHRKPESEDAARVALEPDGLRRTPRARAGGSRSSIRTGTAPAREPQPARPRHEDRPFQQVKPSPAPSQPEAPAPPAAAGQGSPEAEPGESNTARRRRRRRRGRRGGRGRTQDGTPLAADAPADGSSTPPHGDPTADAALRDAGGESDFESDSDSGEDEGPDPSAQ